MVKATDDKYSFMIGKSMSLLNPNGNAVPNLQVYKSIEKLVAKKAEVSSAHRLRSEPITDIE
jgi:hypothetical protein